MLSRNPTPGAYSIRVVSIEQPEALTASQTWQGCFSMAMLFRGMQCFMALKLRFLMCMLQGNGDGVPDCHSCGITSWGSIYAEGAALSAILSRVSRVNLLPHCKALDHKVLLYLVIFQHKATPNLSCMYDSVSLLSCLASDIVPVTHTNRTGSPPFTL